MKGIHIEAEGYSPLIQHQRHIGEDLEPGGDGGVNKGR